MFLMGVILYRIVLVDSGRSICSVFAHFIVISLFVIGGFSLVKLTILFGERFPLFSKFLSNLSDFPFRMLLLNTRTLLVAVEEKRTESFFRRIRI
jgi:hypothetical protein